MRCLRLLPITPRPSKISCSLLQGKHEYFLQQNCRLLHQVSETQSNTPNPKGYDLSINSFAKSPFMKIRKVKKEKYVVKDTVEVTKKNITQSVFKLRFLVMLIRGAWMPDALAQMKFTPKIHSPAITKMLTRSIALAKLNYGAIPEELRVVNVFATKGLITKRLTYMGRGRSGLGYKRRSHIRILVEKIDFPEFIKHQETLTQRKKWQKRYALVQVLRKKLEETSPITATPIEN